ncbi:hypothetical protein AK830_g5591 [Neonectria ditissima]|uniref:F-box domain-containing protein n=1 Tax=Neonectria ditissima TaxID=78410 RepID=A0A0P7BKF5_9HYPO|nr:hypothetical protein AK830_g5591 [Neonectria ditissima]
MTSRRALPLELLCHVMESVLPPNPSVLLPASHVSTKTLLALTLVCRDTYRMANKLLRQRCVLIDTKSRLADYLVCMQRFVPTMPAPPSLSAITSLYLEPFGRLLNDLLAAMWMRELLCQVSDTLRRLVVLIPFQNAQPLHNWQELRRTLREGFERLHKLEEFVAIGDYPVLSVPDAPTDVWRLWPELKRLTLFNAPTDNHWLWWDIATLPKLQHVILARPLSIATTNIKDEYFHKLPRDDARLDRDIRIVLMEDGGLAPPEMRTARWKEIDPHGRMTVELQAVPENPVRFMDPAKLVADFVKEQALSGCLWDGETRVVEESKSKSK